ncbi:MAG: 2Fe-2S iron-sulfur cluster-binding protein, partial [Anaerolineales bacterium]
MANHRVTFLPAGTTIDVPTGTLISEAIQNSDLEISQPCGGQGRCGRCAVLVESGDVRRRSTIRLTAKDLEAGWALACQAVIEGDATITIPEQERIERRLVTEHTARKVEVPFDYDPARLQTVHTLQLELNPPTIDDNLDDLSRLQKALSDLGYGTLEVPLDMLRKLGDTLRAADWNAHVVIERRPEQPDVTRLIDISTEP